MNVKYQSQEVKIIIEENILHSLNKYLNSTVKYLLLTDENVYSLYNKCFQNLPNLDYYIIKPGENSKTIDNALEIISFLLNNNYSRKDMIIAFGGGVIGDLGGFIASIYKRGIEYLNIPTTLISQVDSAFGGKVGVNYLGYKNQIGSIYHPSLILVDPLVLKTLDEENYLSGMCEVVKYAALFDREMFSTLEKGNYQIIDLIKKCINYKLQITTEDEFDTNARQLLNFGHTIGHAIEAKYSLPHGISIGYGMYLESKNERIKNLLIKLGLDFTKKFHNLLPHIVKDKKIKDNKITVIKLRDIGEAYLEEADISEYFNE